jgi:hypothetical protein
MEFHNVRRLEVRFLCERQQGSETVSFSKATRQDHKNNTRDLLEGS